MSFSVLYDFFQYAAVFEQYCSVHNTFAITAVQYIYIIVHSKSILSQVIRSDLNTLLLACFAQCKTLENRLETAQKETKAARDELANFVKIKTEACRAAPRDTTLGLGGAGLGRGGARCDWATRCCTCCTCFTLASVRFSLPLRCVAFSTAQCRDAIILYSSNSTVQYSLYAMFMHNTLDWIYCAQCTCTSVRK